jgi:putative redox protein
MPNQASIRLGDGYKTTIKVRDFTFHTDEPADAGGTDEAPTPMELLVSSLGSCVAVTCKLYANRKKWPLEGVDIDVTHERVKAVDYPAYEGSADFVNDFQLKIVFKGPLTEEQLARLHEIAGKCPVHRVLISPNFIEDTLVDEL